MTISNRKAVATFYIDVLKGMNRQPVKLEDTGDPNVPALSMLDHCLHMCYEILTLLNRDRVDRADRYLGFIQGVFAAYCMYTIREMSEHNRTGANS